MTGLQDALCGATRPGHFRGVCTVVLKLFNIVPAGRGRVRAEGRPAGPGHQQMVRDLNVPVRVAVEPTVREPDGLAMSSPQPLPRSEPSGPAAPASTGRCKPRRAAGVRRGDGRGAALEAGLRGGPGRDSRRPGRLRPRRGRGRRWPAARPAGPARPWRRSPCILGTDAADRQPRPVTGLAARTRSPAHGPPPVRPRSPGSCSRTTTPPGCRRSARRSTRPPSPRPWRTSSPPKQVWAGHQHGRHPHPGGHLRVPAAALAGRDGRGPGPAAGRPS